jgi:hypothetical protein
LPICEGNFDSGERVSTSSVIESDTTNPTN